MDDASANDEMIARILGEEIEEGKSLRGRDVDRASRRISALAVPVTVRFTDPCWGVLGWTASLAQQQQAEDAKLASLMQEENQLRIEVADRAVALDMEILQR